MKARTIITLAMLCGVAMLAAAFTAASGTGSQPAATTRRQRSTVARSRNASST